jgi:hypothetical protein
MSETKIEKRLAALELEVADLKKKVSSFKLTEIEQEELDSISELDQIFTYLNSLLVAQK